MTLNSAPSHGTSQTPHGKLATGKSVVNRNERTYHRGSLMFIEGETSTEMYIIKSGKIRILKQEGESTVELAVLGPGSVLGELALLDHQPRTATAQVIEDVAAAVIDEGLFTRTLAVIPPWLKDIIMEVVKRLRITMKKTSDDVVQKSIAGVIRVMTLQNNNEGFEKDGCRCVSLSQAKALIFSVIGLGALEAENVFLHLILKDMILIRKNELGQEFVILKNPDVLLLYMNYLRAKQRASSMVGEEFTEKSADLLNVLVSVGEKNGKKIQAGLVAVGQAQLELELDRLGKGRYLDLDALDELVRGKVVVKQEESTDSKYGTHKRATLVFNIDTLKRLCLLTQWLPIFKEEVKF
jgi:CRP/FNR family transcriptional regulator, cyclic AMP receptor protein